MRRSTRLGLLVGVPLIVLVFAAYSAVWLIVAKRIEGGIGPLAQSLRARNVELAWRSAGVGGFPFAFRVTFTDVQVHDRSPDPRGEATLPLLSASAAPWHLHVWSLAAPKGLTAATPPGSALNARITARSADGSVVISEGAAGTLWLGFDDPAVDVGVHAAARRAFLRLDLPGHPPLSHTEAGLGFTLDIADLALPFVPPPLANPLDAVSLGVTVKGAFPQQAARDAAAAWRDAGGTIELDYLALRWGALAIHASGTMALDAGLQPTIALSGGIEGYPELMRALVATRRIRRSDAGIADLALALLARPGPNGRPEIATSFTVQDGQMFLGPAKLGPAPRISW